MLPRTVGGRSEAALPEIGEQGILVVGLLLGTELGLRGGGLLLRLGGDGICFVASGLGGPPLRRRLHFGLGLRAQRLNRLECGLDGRGCRMALGLGACHLLQQRLALLGDRRHPQAVVVEDLHGAALAGIEIADEPAGRHLVELDARQLTQPFAAFLAQPLGVTDGRAQRLVELAFLAVQLGDRALDRRQRLPSGPHQQALPLGDEATLERHLIVDRQHAAPLHAEAVLLDDAVVALVRATVSKVVLRHAHAELGDGFDDAGLFVADRQAQLSPVGSDRLRRSDSSCAPGCREAADATRRVLSPGRDTMVSVYSRVSSSRSAASSR